MKTALPLLLTLAVLAGCGGDERSGAAPAPTTAGGARTCPGPVMVPGHEGVDVRVQGTECARAEQVIAAAVGQGRRPYEAAGFSCRPSPADGGDTDYACTGGGGARITFRYGAA